MGTWSEVRLGSVATVVRGGSPRPIEKYTTTDETGINWIKIGDIPTHSKYVESAGEKIIPEGALRSRRVQAGDFILSNSMSFGRPYILKIDGCIHDGWLAISNYETSIDKDFLYYSLSSAAIQRQFGSLSAGSTVHNLKSESVQAVVLFLPGLEEQRRVAAVLTAADEAIAASCALAEKYAAVKRGLMRDLLGRGNAVRLDSGIVRMNPYTRERLPERFYYIDLEAVIDGMVVKDVILRRTEAPSRAQRLLKPNDILFQTVRPYQQNHYLFRQERELPTVASTGYALMRTKSNPGYLYYALHQDAFIREVTGRTTGTNYPAINTAELKKCRINFEPDKNKQDSIAEILTAADRRLTAERERLRKLEDMKRGLMDDLLTNRVSTDRR